MISLEDAALVAIAQGAETVDDLARALRISREDAERLLRKLSIEGLVKIEEKGWWIFRRKVVVLTERGFERAARALDQLKSLAETIRQKLESGEREYVDSIFAQWGYILPLMMWLNLLDIAFLNMLALDTAMMFPGIEDTGDTGDMGTDFDTDVDYA